MRELPRGWATAEMPVVLGDLATGNIIDQGWSPKCENFPSDDENTWGALKTTAIQDGWFEQQHTKQLPTHLDPKPALEVRAGDLLMTCAGPRVRCGVICKVEQVRRKLFISGKMYRFRPNENVADGDYLLGVLRSPELQIAIDQIKTGGSESGLNLTQDRFRNLTIPLPPLPEQRRIVRKLDTLTARTTTARTHLSAIEKLVERYKLAVLRGAFFVDPSGKLDEGEAVASKWEIRPLGKALDNLDNKRIPIKSEDRKKRHGPYDYYGASGVIDKIDEYLFDGRYLLIGEDGANLVARSSPIAFIAEGQFWVNNHAHVLGETADTDLDWVRLYFAAIKLEPFVTGSAQPKLTQANLNKILVPLPAIDEQREIVRRIETAFANIDRLAAEAKKALQLTDRLDQRILAKAFAGELVPQDPNDEPAETLLARIRAERAAAPKPKRGRKKASQ